MDFKALLLLYRVVGEMGEGLSQTADVRGISIGASPTIEGRVDETSEGLEAGHQHPHSHVEFSQDLIMRSRRVTVTVGAATTYTSTTTRRSCSCSRSCSGSSSSSSSSSEAIVIRRATSVYIEGS